MNREFQVTRLKVAVVRATAAEAWRECERLARLGHEGTPFVWGGREPVVGRWWHQVDVGALPRVLSEGDHARLQDLLARVGPMAPAVAAGERYAEAAGRIERESSGQAAKDMRPEHAQWALDLYKSCIEDAEADPWFEPGGAERRFIAKLREYAGLRDGGAEKAARRRFGL